MISNSQKNCWKSSISSFFQQKDSIENFLQRNKKLLCFVWQSLISPIDVFMEVENQSTLTKNLQLRVISGIGKGARFSRLFREKNNQKFEVPQ